MVILRRTQRALLQATLEYLWRSPDHGGLREAEGFAVLPTALPRHLPNIEENNPPAPLPSPPQTPSSSDTSSRRARLDEGSFVAAFSTGATSEAGTRSSPSGAPLTKVTLSKQVRVKFISKNTGQQTFRPRQLLHGVTYCFMLAHHHGPGHCNVALRGCRFGGRTCNVIEVLTQGLHDEANPISEVQAYQASTTTAVGRSISNVMFTGLTTTIKA